MKTRFDHDWGTSTTRAAAVAVLLAFWDAQLTETASRCKHVSNKLYLCRKLGKSLGI